MQSRYAKLEFEQARNLWMSVRPGGDVEGEVDCEATFATLVEQVNFLTFLHRAASGCLAFSSFHFVSQLFFQLAFQIAFSPQT
jgi:hypothetical protein